MCYNDSMPIFIGITLFIIGTLAALVAVAAVISYLRTMSVYMSLKRLYRASFHLGAIGIAVLVSFLFFKVFISGEFFATAEEVNITDVATAQVKEPEQKKETKTTKSKSKKTEKEETEPAVTEPAASEPAAIEPVQAEEPQQAAQPAAEPVTAPAVQPAVKKSLLIPSFSVWTNVYKGQEYAYVEVENGTPYVYMPNYRGTFWYDLNNISSGRESSNIVVMANAGVFNDDSSPKGAVIQNGNVASVKSSNSSIPNTLVIDETGNVGYTNKAVTSNVVSYTDALTGQTVSGRKIVSAITAFSPIVINGQAATQYKSKVANYSAYRPRSIFCVRKSNSYTIITNKGEGEGTGGWNFDDMATVALRRGCQFAFNLDGGGSTALAWRISTNLGFSTYVATERHDPTYIVFTSNNLAPAGK